MTLPITLHSVPLMRARLTLATILLLPAAPLAAAAQPFGWSLLPGGVPAYTDTYSTFGNFFCYGGGGQNGGFAPGSSCEASGNTLRLGNGGSFLTLTFTGLTQTITATNHRESIGTLGSITATTSGVGDFRFPVPNNSGVVSFGFRLGLVQNSTGATGRHQIGYILPQTPATFAAYNCCGDDSNYDDYTSLPVPSAGYPFRYRSVVFDTFSAPTFTAGNATYNVTGAVGVVPEPSTFALAAAGGLAVVGIARRRGSR